MDFQTPKAEKCDRNQLGGGGGANGKGRG
jgi:hypothetical protein